MEVVIIGNGITGITAAITIRKLSKQHRITVISSESRHFYSRTALMYLYMGHLKFDNLKPYGDWYWEENDIRLVQGRVGQVDFKGQRVELESQASLPYDRLLIASGSVPRRTGLPGEDLSGVQGFYSLRDLETLEYHTRQARQAVVIGGGLIGIELAEMMTSRCLPTSLLVREPHYWAPVLPREEAGLVARQIHRHGVDLKLNTQVQAFEGDAAGLLQAVTTEDGETIPCQVAGVAIGVQPNISFLHGSALATARGILVNEFLQTNIPGVYAAGDCAEFQPREGQAGQIEQIWYTGRMQGETVAYNLCGEQRPYQRGVWFNSAKFFDLEYQTYGLVPAGPQPGLQTLYWQHPDGHKALRIAYQSDTLEVCGLHVLGIRYRHEVCEAWIREKKTVHHVLERLQNANFDPEFFRRYESNIRKAFTNQLLPDPARTKA
ncbi:MAG: NAD(P)/FAD-dependent oxidoreductase [Adhaeribacter sp.]